MTEVGNQQKQHGYKLRSKAEAEVGAFVLPNAATDTELDIMIGVQLVGNRKEIKEPTKRKV